MQRNKVSMLAFGDLRELEASDEPVQDNFDDWVEEQEFPPGELSAAYRKRLEKLGKLIVDYGDSTVVFGPPTEADEV